MKEKILDAIYKLLKIALIFQHEAKHPLILYKDFKSRGILKVFSYLFPLKYSPCDYLKFIENH